MHVSKSPLRAVSAIKNMSKPSASLTWKIRDMNPIAQILLNKLIIYPSLIPLEYVACLWLVTGVMTQPYLGNLMQSLLTKRERKPYERTDKDEKEANKSDKKSEDEIMEDYLFHLGLMSPVRMKWYQESPGKRSCKDDQQWFWFALHSLQQQEREVRDMMQIEMFSKVTRTFFRIVVVEMFFLPSNEKS